MGPPLATVFTPYADFAFAAAGIALGALVLISVTGWRLSFTTSLTLALVALVGVLAVPSLWRGAAGLKDARDSLRTPTTAVRMDKCLLVRSGQVEVARLARRRIAPQDSFAVESLPIDNPCFQLNVLPRRLVSPSDEPDWTLRGAPFDEPLQRRIRRERLLPEGKRKVQLLNTSLVLIRHR